MDDLVKSMGMTARSQRQVLRLGGALGENLGAFLNGPIEGLFRPARARPGRQSAGRRAGKPAG